jgi:hypothetical protein
MDALRFPRLRMLYPDHGSFDSTSLTTALSVTAGSRTSHDQAYSMAQRFALS